jgi:hypothetical protein
MNMHTTFTFQIDLTSREFDLVTKGLCRTLEEGTARGGRYHKGDIRDDIPDALALAEKLMTGRIRESQSQVGRAETKFKSAQDCLYVDGHFVTGVEE